MRRMWRMIAVLVLALGLIPWLTVQVTIADDAVVAAPCGEDEFDAALATALTNGGGTITFACGGPTTIPFTGQKDITAPNAVIIDGANAIRFDGGNATRLLRVQSGASLELRNLTLENGNAGNGNGGAVLARGALKISGSTVRNNQTSNAGGAISSDSTVEIVASTFSENSAGNGGTGGAAHFFDSADVTIANSTFSDNDADEGGAVHFSSRNVSVAIIHSTIVGNQAGFEGGGLYRGNGTLSVAGSIVAHNVAGLASTSNCWGNLVSLGFNLSNNSTCGFNQPGDMLNSANIDLGPLQNNGGSTQTHLPSPGSDAIDNAECSASHDQRGISRPQGDSCDIGAVEFRRPTFPLCASLYTGAVMSPLWGGCGVGKIELLVSGNLTFCINTGTGQLFYFLNKSCNPPFLAHKLSDDGDLLTCVHVFTMSNRWVLNHSQCSTYEKPNTIPAMG